MKLAFLLLCILLLIGCADAQAPAPAPELESEEASLPESSSEIIPEEIESCFISPLSEEHLLDVESYSDAREGEIEYVIIHFTSAVMLSRSDPYDVELIRGIFESNELSVHYVIDRDGKIYCYVPEDRSAWHAGRGSWRGIENRMNHHSVGIELIAMGSEADMAQYLTSAEYNALDSSLMGFTEAQYSSLSALVSDVCERNSIPLDRDHVIGHSDYNPSKSDPGELFDFSRILG